MSSGDSDSTYYFEGLFEDYLKSIMEFYGRAFNAEELTRDPQRVAEFQADNLRRILALKEKLNTLGGIKYLEDHHHLFNDCLSLFFADRQKIKLAGEVNYPPDIPTPEEFLFLLFVLRRSNDLVDFQKFYYPHHLTGFAKTYFSQSYVWVFVDRASVVKFRYILNSTITGQEKLFRNGDQDIMLGIAKKRFEKLGFKNQPAILFCRRHQYRKATFVLKYALILEEDGVRQLGVWSI